MTLADRIAQRSPAVRRPLAVLLLLLTATLAWRDVIVPMREVLTSQHRWRVQVRSSLAIARGQAAAAPTLQRRLRALPEAPIWQRFYPDGDSANADTALREDITRYAAVAGVVLRSITPLPTTDQFGLRTLGVRISAVMSIGQLTDFLAQLRGSPRYLRVDALRVVAPQVQLKSRNHRLLVRLQLFGYARLVSGGRE
jgi:Tfp pilus assembly protein PilO